MEHGLWYYTTWCMSYMLWRIVLGNHHLLHGWGVDDQAAVFIANHGDFHTWIILIPSYGFIDICKPVVTAAYHNIASRVCSHMAAESRVSLAGIHHNPPKTWGQPGRCICIPVFFTITVHDGEFELIDIFNPSASCP